MLRIWLQFALCTAAIGCDGYHLSRYDDVVAERTGLGRTLIGAVIVAMVTSLPALAVSASALRLGALDLAIGNLLGSNLFDIAIIAIDESACTAEPQFASVSRAHAGTVVNAMVVSGAVIAAPFYPPAGREFRACGWTGLFLLVAYTINVYVLYLAGKR